MSKRRKIELRRERVRLAKLGKHKKLKKADYLERLPRLQQKLQRIQQAYHASGERAVILFEGWDAAGKGSTIRRLSQYLDPRGFKVWPIAAPRAHELERHYLFRFWERLPPHGSIAVFDRSWYGRVLVERVEGLAGEAEWKRAYDEINEFERLLLDDGMRLVKIFLHITAEEQLARFRERLTDPLKRWKITQEDFHNRARRSDYEVAIEEMAARTATRHAPWHLVPANDKRFARIECLKLITERLAKGIDLAPRALDEPTLEAAYATFGADFDIDGEAGD